MLPDECHSNISEIRPNRTKDIGLHNGTFCGRTKNDVKKKLVKITILRRSRGRGKVERKGRGKGRKGDTYWDIGS